jgi:hypothetical protein
MIHGQILRQRVLVIREAAELIFDRCASALAQPVHCCEPPCAFEYYRQTNRRAAGTLEQHEPPHQRGENACFRRDQQQKHIDHGQTPNCQDYCMDDSWLTICYPPNCRLAAVRNSADRRGWHDGQLLRPPTSWQLSYAERSGKCRTWVISMEKAIPFLTMLFAAVPAV